MTNYWDTIGRSPEVGDFTIHSADTHVVEPRDLWTERLDKKFRDRAPQVEAVDGRDFWFCEGTNLMHCGHKATRWAPEGYSGKYDEQRPGGMLPDKCVEDSDLDGVDVNVFFPSVSIRLYGIADPQLTAAVFRAYNDWLADFCSYEPRRLKGVGVLLLPEDVDAAVTELERCASLGFVGAMIPMLAAPDRTYDDPVYDPLWAAAQADNFPLMMHTGGIRTTTVGPQPINTSRPVGTGGSDVLPRDNVIAMIYGRVFERYPALQVGVMEMGVGWIPYFMRSIDRSYLVRREGGPNPNAFADGMAPSDFIRRNVFFGYQDEDLGVLFRDIIGVDNLLYANDYPHPDCVWPRSRQVLEQIFDSAGCSKEDRAKLAGGNAVRIFDLKAV